MDWRVSFREAAEKRRWQWRALARETGINPETLQGWVQEKSKGQPTIIDAIKLADPMEMTLDELFRGIVPDDRPVAAIQRIIDEVRRAERAAKAAEAGDTA